jgi:hypothetical protein
MVLLWGVFIALISPSLAAAQDVRVQCPAKIVDIKISGGFSSEWTSPKRVARYTKSKLGRYKGKPALLCGYAAFGAMFYIARPQPDKLTGCKPARGGFLCGKAGTTPVARSTTQATSPNPRDLSATRSPPPAQAQQDPLQAQQDPLQAQQGPLQAQQDPLQAQQGPLQAQKGPLQAQKDPLQAQKDPLQAQKESSVQSGSSASAQANVAAGHLALKQTPARNTALRRARRKPRPGASGRLAIPPTWTADLDKARIGAGDFSDLWLKVRGEQADGIRELAPINGALALVLGRNEPNRETCEQTTLSAAPVPLQNLANGSFLCARTNEGRFAIIEILETRSSRSSALSVSYETW